MAAISSLTTRSGKPRALSGGAIRMLGHDVDGLRGSAIRSGPSRKATLTAPRVLSERKTGLYVRNVETVRLVRDERGWLQLVG